MSASAGRLAARQDALTLDGAGRLLLYLLPLAVAFGSLAPLSVGSLRAGVTDALVAGLVALGLVWLWRSPDAHWAARRPLVVARLLWRTEPQALALFGALLAYLAVIVLSITVAITRSGS